MYCMKCGAKVDDNTQVCPNCGIQVKNTNDDSVVAKNTLQEPSVPQVAEVQSTKSEEKVNTQSVQANNNNDALVKYIKGMNMTKIIVASAIVVVVIAAIIALVVVISRPKPEKGPGPQEVDTVSTLMKVVKTSSFSTYEVVYNGVCTVYNEKKPENIDYYVSYTATIKAGFDFNEIKISKDEENNEILISLPPIELYEPNVKIEDLDYIVVNKKVKTETISADAYKICRADVEERAKNQDAIYKYAKENGERLVKGLITPFLDNLDKEYTIRFEWRETK